MITLVAYKPYSTHTCYGHITDMYQSHHFVASSPSSRFIARKWAELLEHKYGPSESPYEITILIDGHIMEGDAKYYEEVAACPVFDQDDADLANRANLFLKLWGRKEKAVEEVKQEAVAEEQKREASASIKV